MNNYYIYKTTLGDICIEDNIDAITGLSFVNKKEIISDASFNNNSYMNETPLIQRAFIQLGEYLNGCREVFDLPILLEGTEFQKTVWKALMNIPYGETRSYKDIAIAIGNEKACRAVGGANNKNPIAIIVPCHRVIGANHSLVGYGGGLPIKEKLLKLENKDRKK